MQIRKVLVGLDKELQIMVSNKYDARDFWSKSGAVAQKYFEENKLPFTLDYNGVRYTGAPNLSEHNCCIAFVKWEKRFDMRKKFNQSFKLISLMVEAYADADYNNMTIEELDKFLHIKDFEFQLNNVSEQLTEAEEEVKRLTAQKTEIAEKLAEWKSICIR